MLMLCFSTEQNSTNLIPAIQISEIKEIVIIESAIAEARNWAEGMIGVLEKRGKKTDKIQLKVGDGSRGEDTQIHQVFEKINEYILTKTKSTDTIYWNIGGGLKPLMLAMYQAYMHRDNPTDKICYANPFNAKPSIDFVQKIGGIQSSGSININVDLSAAEIIETYGLKIKDASLFYKKNSLNSPNTVKDYFKYKEFRNYVFELSQTKYIDLSKEFSLKNLADGFNDPDKVKFFKKSISDSLEDYFTKKNVSKADIETAYNNAGLINELKYKHFFGEQKLSDLVNNLKSLFINKKKDFHESLFARTLNYTGELEPIPIENTELADELNTRTITKDDTLLKSLGFGKASAYFEGILEKRVYEFLKLNNHKIIEAYSNVKVITESNKLTAEYDVLLVTNHGTVIALEAKTFDFEQKDMDARQFNLEKATSRIGEMYVVLPYDPEDFNEPFFSQNLEDLPFRLAARNTKFLVIADSVADKSFWIKRVANKLKKLDFDGNKTNKMVDTDEIQMNKLESFFDKLEN